MKTIFFILVMVIMVGNLSAVQPVRKPFVKIKVDGAIVKSGEILTITKGQKLKLEGELEGGRRDFCKFPDSYADMAGTAQIISRGENGLTYILNDKKAEWKLLNEEVRFTADDFIKIVSSENQRTAELVASNQKFSQSFVKVTIKATWQFSEDGKVSQEENVAEGIVYFRMEGSSDMWFISKNIKASGIKNESIQEKLNLVQSACDSIEKNLNQLDFSAARQSISNLQTFGGELKLAIDEQKSSNPSYQIKIIFSGLPSDQPYSDISTLSSIKTYWATLEAFVNELKQELGKLPQQPTSDSKDQLVKIISSYDEWQSKLPEQTIEHLSFYIPEIQADSILIPENVERIAREKIITDYPKTLNDFSNFLNQRGRNVSTETQSINSTSTRIQAVRLFDGMLRSYFASIGWAEWVNTREQ